MQKSAGIQESRIYQAIDPISEMDAAALFARNDSAELAVAVISVGLYSENVAWAEQFCQTLATHPIANVRGNAILALGYLGRRFGMLATHHLDLVQNALMDPDAYVRGQAHSVIEDIESGTGLRLQVPPKPTHPHTRYGIAAIVLFIGDMVWCSFERPFEYPKHYQVGFAAWFLGCTMTVAAYFVPQRNRTFAHIALAMVLVSMCVISISLPSY